MLSLVQSLKKIDKKPPFSVTNDFQTYPNSLKEMIRIMNLPEPQIEMLGRRKVKEFTEENSQGLTYADNNIWFLSSEKNIFKYSIEGDDLFHPTKINRLQKVNLSDLIGSTSLDKKSYDHIGDISYFDGLIFVSVRHCKHLKLGPFPFPIGYIKKTIYPPPHLLLVLSENLEVVGYTILPEDISDSWCAINPWNGLLYMPNNKHSDYLNVFDVSNYYHLLSKPDQWRKSVAIKPVKDKYFRFYKKDGSPDTPSSIQGIAFSQNGRLYITRYNSESVFLGIGTKWENFMYVYNALTGIQLDTSSEINFAGGSDEIEGLAVHPSSVIYTAVAINDIVSTDEFEIHAFKYPDNSHQM